MAVVPKTDLRGVIGSRLTFRRESCVLGALGPKNCCATPDRTVVAAIASIAAPAAVTLTKLPAVNVGTSETPPVTIAKPTRAAAMATLFTILPMTASYYFLATHAQRSSTYPKFRGERAPAHRQRRNMRSHPLLHQHYRRRKQDRLFVHG